MIAAEVFAGLDSGVCRLKTGCTHDKSKRKTRRGGGHGLGLSGDFDFLS